MDTKKTLNWGILAAVFCMALPTWVTADTTQGTTAGSNDKVGTNNAAPQYNSGVPDNTAATADPKNSAKTVPSGKRHRTHMKKGHQGQSADANKTINASDVTPSN